MSIIKIKQFHEKYLFKICNLTLKEEKIFKCHFHICKYANVILSMLKIITIIFPNDKMQLKEIRIVINKFAGWKKYLF